MQNLTSRKSIGGQAVGGRSRLAPLPALALALALSLGAAPATEAAQVEVLDPIALPSGFLYPNGITQVPDGTLFITDTSIPRILTLPPGANRLSVLLWDERLASDGEGVDGIGAAGIAIAADGQSLLVGLYGAGTVFAIEDSGAGNMQARPLELQRPLENPDGFTVDRNGDLLLVEGSVASGNGRLTRIVDPLSAGPRPVETLVEDLDIPVNLLIDAADPSLVYVTESGLGHRFTDSRRALSTKARISAMRSLSNWVSISVDIGGK